MNLIESEYMSLRRAAAMSGVPREVLLRWARQGLITASQAGPRLVLIRRADLQEILERNRLAEAAEPQPA